MQSDSSKDAVLRSGNLGRPARGREVGANLNDTDDSYLGGSLELKAIIERFVAVGDFEVSVVVVDSNRQCRGCRRVRKVFSRIALGRALADVG